MCVWGVVGTVVILRVCLWYVYGSVVHVTAILSVRVWYIWMDLVVCGTCSCGHTSKTRVCCGLRVCLCALMPTPASGCDWP